MRFKFVKCICGWRQDTNDVDDAGQLAIDHLPVCQYEAKALFTPMWSIAHPYRWGTLPKDHLGIEIEWRVTGTNDEYPHSQLAKNWHLFLSCQTGSDLI